jgi:exopolyphosphatase/guanosine-5'-triphosphate,3'-diphosphate pyrophosphatase
MGFDYVAMSSGTASALAGLAGGGGGGGGDNPSAVKTLTVESLGALERRLAATTLEQRSQLPGLDPRRADTVLPGAVVLRTALDLIGASEATVCDAALREGIVADYIASHRPGILLVEEFPDLRRRSVMELARRCSFDEAHAQQVARLALSLFHQTRDLHGLEEQDAELLELAGLLHDIGFHISPNRHHHHAQYLIETHDMIGFSREEVQVIALAARYHRKAVPPSGGAKGARRRHRAFYRLRKRDRRRVRYLAALLRIADALDRSHARLVRAVRCALRGKTVELRLEVEGDPELELWAARRKGDLLESLTGWRLRLAIDAVADTRRDRASVAPATARGNEPSANPAEPTRRLRPPKVLAGKTPATRRTRSVRLVRPR